MRLLPAATATTLALLGAGCGAGTATVAPGHHRLALRIGDYYVQPQDVDVLAGPLVLTVRNVGYAPHDLVLKPKPAGPDPGSTPVLMSHQSATIVTRLAPGTYTMHSVVGRDTALGLHGTLHVGGG